MYKKLFSHSLIYGLAPYIPYLASIFILPLTTPHLTAFDFGVFGIVMSYLGFLNVLQYLGLHVNFNNSFFYSRLRYKWLWRQIYGFLYIWNFVFSIIIAIIIYFILPTEIMADYSLIAILTVIPFVLFGPIDLIARSFYQLNKKPFPIVVRSVVFGLMTGLLNLIFIKYLQMGYMGWFWSLAIVKCLTALSWIYPIIIKEKITPIYNFKKTTIKRSLSVSLPLVPHANALMLLNQSDRVVMDFMNVSANQIGVYTAAYNLGSTVDAIGNGYNKAITPFFYQLLKEKKERQIRQLIFISQIAFFLIGLVFSLIAKEFMEFLIRNDELNNMYPLMVVIAMAVIFKPMYIASTIRYFYFEKTKLFAIYSLAAGIINILLNIIFIPIFGIEAAAFSTFVGFMLLSYSRFWPKSFKELSPLPYYEHFWMIASVVVCLLGYYMSQLDLNIRIIIFLITFILLMPVFYFIYKKTRQVK
ncbi:oligosaccharide flippase family protein [Flavobacteriaceae bacterium Ap0902]|nr:oligosaccharide flippase family protein [Flavobacteriaceae bacterium Ap0902]